MFEKLKQYLASLLLLKQQEKGDVICTYHTIFPYVVSIILMKEEGAAQYLVYYVYQALREAEVWYPQVEILAFALVMVARRLCPYFQTHMIKVLIEAPLAKALRKPNSAGRLIK